MANWPYNTARWQRLRALHLHRQPLCQWCESVGTIRSANTVDHRIPISAGGPAFPSHDGLASYCAGCHSAKTARGIEAGKRRTTKPRKGCNPDGSPLDPNHPWHPASQSLQDRKSLTPAPSQTAAPSNIELVSFDDGIDDLWE